MRRLPRPAAPAAADPPLRPLVCVTAIVALSIGGWALIWHIARFFYG